MKYAIYDTAGLFIQYANDATAITLPLNAIVLTEEQWNNRFDIKFDLTINEVVPYSIPKLLSDILPSKIKKVKEEALKRIIATIPGADASSFLIKETNLLARVSELVRKESKGTITSSEITELNGYDAMWSRIKSIRTSSDSIEVEINVLTTYDAVNSYNIEANPLWPV